MSKTNSALDNLMDKFNVPQEIIEQNEKILQQREEAEKQRR